MTRKLDWREVGDGVWLARTQRRDARYRISVRRLPDGDVFDVRRSIIGGLTFIGSATSLERAQELAQANYQQLRTSDRIEAERAATAYRIASA